MSGKPDSSIHEHPSHHHQKISSREVTIIAGYLLLAFSLLNFYFHNDIFHNFVDTWNEYLEGAIFIHNDYFPPISILDFAGSVICCYKYRTEAKGLKSWFEVLFSVTLMQFGGTTITGIVFLGQTPSWIMSRAAFPALLVAWWLTFYCPGDAYWKLVREMPFFVTVMTFFAYISIAHAIGSWGVDSVLKNSYHINPNYSRGFLLNIWVGTIAACGGGVLCELFGFLRSNSYTIQKTPSIFSVGNYPASASINRCFWFALVYYFLVSDRSTFLPSPHLPLVTAHSVMAILHVVLFFLHQHNISFDIFQFMSDEVLETLEIPPALEFGEEDHAKND